MTLTLYGPKGTRTIRVLWFAEETGLTLDHRPEHPKGETVADLNPLKQVPVLIDGDAVITDSVTILGWLSDREGKLTYPHTTPERARLDARIRFVVGDMEAPVWLWQKRKLFAPEGTEPDPALLDDLRADYARAERNLNLLMGGMDYLAGDDFTIADIVAGHVGGWGRSIGFEPETPEFAAYVDRMQSRDALARARAR